MATTVGCFHYFPDALAELRDCGGMLLWHPHHVDCKESWQVLHPDDFVALYPDCEDLPKDVCRLALQHGGMTEAEIGKELIDWID